MPYWAVRAADFCRPLSVLSWTVEKPLWHRSAIRERISAAMSSMTRNLGLWSVDMAAAPSLLSAVPDAVCSATALSFSPALLSSVAVASARVLPFSPASPLSVAVLSAGTLPFSPASLPSVAVPSAGTLPPCLAVTSTGALPPPGAASPSGASISSRSTGYIRSLPSRR